jgi:PKHD-type hydroxylase
MIGANYLITNFPKELIKEVLKNNENALEKGSINEVSGLTTRTSSVSWIKNRNTCQKVFSVMKKQAEQFSSLHLDNIEPLQYSEYGNDQEYGWHKDVRNIPYTDGRIRKLSFSIFLNDNYEGGEFDLESYSPDTSTRYLEVKKQNNANCIIFNSDMWHRVRPVTSGVKKSIVGWMLGPMVK